MTIPRNACFFLRIWCEEAGIYKDIICFHKQFKPVSQPWLTPVTQYCSEPPTEPVLELSKSPEGRMF